MDEVGIDLRGHSSKFLGTARRLHRSFDDPSRATGSEAERLQTFRRVRDEIAAAITGWLATEGHIERWRDGAACDR